MQIRFNDLLELNIPDGVGGSIWGNAVDIDITLQESLIDLLSDIIA